MTLIFTLDNKNGTRCMGKRQSKDVVVADRIVMQAENLPLRMKHKSLKFFPCVPAHVRFLESFEELEENDICFAEEVVPSDVMARADRVIVFRWNRDYPSHVDDRVSLDGFVKQSTEDFRGHSHDNITMEVYVK